MDEPPEPYSSDSNRSEAEEDSNRGPHAFPALTLIDSLTLFADGNDSECPAVDGSRTSSHSTSRVIPASSLSTSQTQDPSSQSYSQMDPSSELECSGSFFSALDFQSQSPPGSSKSQSDFTNRTYPQSQVTSVADPQTNFASGMDFQSESAKGPNTKQSQFETGPKIQQSEFAKGPNTQPSQYASRLNARQSTTGPNTERSESAKVPNIPQSPFEKGPNTPQSQFVMGPNTPQSQFAMGQNTQQSQFEKGPHTLQSQFAMRQNNPQSELAKGPNTLQSQFEKGPHISQSQFEKGPNTPQSQFAMSPNTEQKELAMGSNTPQSQFEKGQNISQSQFEKGPNTPQSQFAMNNPQSEIAKGPNTQQSQFETRSNPLQFAREPNTQHSQFAIRPNTQQSQFEKGPNTLQFASGLNTQQSELARGPNIEQSQFEKGPNIQQSESAWGSNTPQSQFATGPNTPQSQFATGPNTPQSQFAMGSNTLQSQFATGPNTPQSQFATGPNTQQSQFAMGPNTPQSRFAVRPNNPQGQFEKGPNTQQFAKEPNTPQSEFTRGPNTQQSLSEKGPNTQQFAKGPNTQQSLSARGLNTYPLARGPNSQQSQFEKEPNMLHFASGPNTPQSQFAMRPNTQQFATGPNTQQFATGPNTQQFATGPNTQQFATGPNTQQSHSARGSNTLQSERARGPITQQSQFAKGSNTPQSRFAAGPNTQQSQLARGPNTQQFAKGPNTQQSHFATGQNALQSELARGPITLQSQFGKGPNTQPSHFASGINTQQSQFATGPNTPQSQFVKGPNTQQSQFVKGPNTQQSQFATEPNTQQSHSARGSNTLQSQFAKGPNTPQSELAKGPNTQKGQSAWGPNTQHMTRAVSGQESQYRFAPKLDSSSHVFNKEENSYLPSRFDDGASPNCFDSLVENPDPQSTLDPEYLSIQTAPKSIRDFDSQSGDEASSGETLSSVRSVSQPFLSAVSQKANSKVAVPPTAKSSPGQRTCEQCRKAPIRYQCLQCSKLLCDVCRDKHRRDKHPLLLLDQMDNVPSHEDDSTKRSVFKTRTELGNTDSHNAVADSEVQCVHHQFQNLTHYCVRCSVALCQVCLQSKEHTTHKVAEMDKAANDAKETLLKAKINVERCLQHLKDARSDLTLQQQHLENKFGRVAKSIQQRAAEARALIDQHERQELASLKDTEDKLKRNLTKDISSAESKTTAVIHILNHVNRTVDSGNELKLIKTQDSALGTISQPSYFDKFTDDLPNEVYDVEHEYNGFDQLASSLKACIGKAAVTKSTQRPPLVSMVNTFSFDTQRKIYDVCPASENRLWLVYTEGIGDSTITTTSKITLLSLEKSKMSKPETVAGRVTLAKLDDHGLVLIQYKHSKQLLCTGGEVVPLVGSRDPLKNLSTLLTNKGKVRCSLFHQCLENGSSRVMFRSLTAGQGLDALSFLQTSASTDEENSLKASPTEKTEEGIEVPDTDSILSMDLNHNGMLLAVVDRNHVLRIYQRVKSTSMMMMMMKKEPQQTFKLVGTNCQNVTDVCFYFLGTREVLLLADPTQNDVLILDLDKPSFAYLGHLTDWRGTVPHPCALQVDPSNGHLCVACDGKSIVILKGTGANI